MVDLREIERIQLQEFKFHLLNVLNKYRMLIKGKGRRAIIVKTDIKTKIMDATFVEQDGEMWLELSPITVEKNGATRKANEIRRKLSR